MWKEKYNTYGFRVTFISELPGAEFEPQTHMYGTMDRNDNFETLEIDYQLASLGICADTEHSNPIYRDFEGLQFTDSDGATQTLSPNCEGGFDTIDLRGRSLLGFKVTVSDFTNGYRNIRTICPIVQNNCPISTIEIEELDDMLHFIGTGNYEQAIIARNVIPYIGETTDCGEITYRF